MPDLQTLHIALPSTSDAPQAGHLNMFIFDSISPNRWD
jgi:hypothetical protein